MLFSYVDLLLKIIYYFQIADKRLAQTRLRTTLKKVGGVQASDLFCLQFPLLLSSRFSCLFEYALSSFWKMNCLVVFGP